MKTRLSYYYKILILIVCIVGLYLNFTFLPFYKSALYFTIISNLACALFYLIYIILNFKKNIDKKESYYILKGMMSISMILTMIIYQFMVFTGTVDVYKDHELASYFLHIIVPIMIICDYIFFDEKGKLKINYTFIWSLSLIGYDFLVLIYVLCGGVFDNGSKVPYNFLDVNKYGLYRVLFSNVLIYVFCIGLGVIIKKIDARIASRCKNER